MYCSRAGALQFLKGEPTDIPAKSKPTVVELWATWYATGFALVSLERDCWYRAPTHFLQNKQSRLNAVQLCVVGCRCGPCLQVFPHLSQIARANAQHGLTVVGISLEPASPQLQSFVQQQGSNMDYAVCSSHTPPAAWLCPASGLARAL